MYSGKNYSPSKTINNIIVIYNIDYPMICLHIVFETIYSFLLCGFLNRSSRLGGSVASANEAKVSIIRLIHNICIGVKIDYFKAAAPIIVQKTATTLKKNNNINKYFTVNWNYKNFLIES